MTATITLAPTEATVKPFLRLPDDPVESDQPFVKRRFCTETLRLECNTGQQGQLYAWMEANGYAELDHIDTGNTYIIIAERETNLMDENRALRSAIATLQKYGRDLEEDRNQWKLAYCQEVNSE